ncbi:MAG TPA: hypothetical protein VG847_00830 [Chitinophagaceae bacterium]|nr:hypothetical protein [Chitinophagaceae bacterium]
MRSVITIALCCVFMITGLYTTAQIDYPAFRNETIINPADSEKLSFNLYNLSYCNDTEWFGNIPLSGTLFGYELIPEIEYQVSPKLIIKTGVYLQKEFGRPNYTTLQPTFTVKYRAKHSSYIIGTLEGNNNHQFIEPIYDYKWMINEQLENGFQFKVDTKPYDHDLFINWRVAIHPGDPFKERFDIGYVGKFNVIDKAKFYVGVPLQLLYSHAGGQYDADSVPLTSLVNSTMGLSTILKLNHKLLKRIVFDNYYVNYKDISGAKVQAFKQGNAYLSHLLFDFKNVGIDLRYWNAEGYIAPRGMALFNSVSEKYPGLVEKHRELLIVSFIYDREIFKNVNFDFRIIPYKDFIEHITSGTGLEYSYEMYIKYTFRKTIAKIKNELP